MANNFSIVAVTMTWMCRCNCQKSNSLGKKFNKKKTTTHRYKNDLNLEHQIRIGEIQVHNGIIGHCLSASLLCKLDICYNWRERS